MEVAGKDMAEDTDDEHEDAGMGILGNEWVTIVEAAVLFNNLSDDLVISVLEWEELVLTEELGTNVTEDLIVPDEAEEHILEVEDGDEVLDGVVLSQT